MAAIAVATFPIGVYEYEAVGVDVAANEDNGPPKDNDAKVVVVATNFLIAEYTAALEQQDKQQ